MPVHVVPVVRKFAVIVVAAVLLAGCNQPKENANSSQTVTQTIAPAKERPAPTGTEPLTQTVDVDHSPGEEDTGTVNPKKAPPPPRKKQK